MKRYFGNRLTEYCRENYAPWHMPGHKRKNELSYQTFSVEQDVTELPLLDDLHAPEDTLLQSMKQLQEIYGSSSSYYLVNGSSSGILTAISAVCKPGDTIVLARHCHKSVYHAVALLQLKPVYLVPACIEQYGICSSITPEQVQCAFQQHPEAKACILSSPTYEGVISDIRGISKVVHEAGAKLIVDQAHGAHMEFLAMESALGCGADLVIESLHKTLPCFTQSAILHIGKSMDSKDLEDLRLRVERYLHVYQTSSPSYPMIANMEEAILYMHEHRHQWQEQYLVTLNRYREQWKQLEHIHVIDVDDIQSQGGYHYDITKLLLCSKDPQVSGEHILSWLFDQSGIVLEMASVRYALAMSTVMDHKNDFERLNEAVVQLDQQWEARKKTMVKSDNENLLLNTPWIPGEQVVTPGQAWQEHKCWSSLEASIERIAGDFVSVYPPGIPILVPGERISRENIQYLLACRELGLRITGVCEQGIEVLLECQ